MDSINIYMLYKIKQDILSYRPPTVVSLLILSNLEFLLLKCACKSFPCINRALK